MSDLRSACIEAMARELAAFSFSETNPLTVATLSNGFITGATAALDALLGVLAEHADEWAGVVDPYDTPPVVVLDLLAVLREDT